MATSRSKRTLSLALLLLVGCSGGGPSAAIRETCATAQDAQDALRDLLSAQSMASADASEAQTATQLRDQALHDDLIGGIGEHPLADPQALPRANERWLGALDKASASRNAADAADERLAKAVDALAQSANRSGDARLSDVAGRVNGDRANFRAVFSRCASLGAAIRVDEQVDVVLPLSAASG